MTGQFQPWLCDLTSSMKLHPLQCHNSYPDQKCGLFALQQIRRYIMSFFEVIELK